ncbi:MAG TPA: DUF2142 domain-containing protein [Candidatus Dormibacteraeota bacterium]|nr:DUF2142 domain-containing protein [Candidatus Dormibacteraeota bacterium]
MAQQPVDVVRTRPLAGAIRLRPSRRWVLTLLGLASLVAAWIFANPVGAAPQEPAYVVRALAAVSGAVPARLVPPQPCFAHRPERTAACLRSAPPATGVRGPEAGVLTPFLALPTGLVERLASDGYRATYLARALLGLICLLLLGAAARMLGRWGPWPLTGLVVAATPMLVFLSSTATTVGVETCAAICFGAALLVRCQGEDGDGTLLPLAVSGALLALARPAGVVFLLAVVVILLPLLRISRLRGPGTAIALLVVAAAAVLGASWSLTHQPHHTTSGPALARALLAVLGARGALLNLQVGIFGWQDTVPPALLLVLWELMLGLLAAAGLALGGRRLRLALVLAMVVPVLLAAALRTVVVRPDWDTGGTYLLPALAMVPLVAGASLERGGLRPRLDTLLLGAGAAALQLVALWYDGRRYAVGRHGPLVFPSLAQWTPPGGWWPWLALATVGAVLLALSLWPPFRPEGRAGARPEEGRPAGVTFDTARVSVGR